MQTELEQTQLEIARLQLEQERRKLVGLQKRQRVVDDLGAGAAAVGGAAKSGLRWAVFITLGATIMGVLGALSSALGLAMSNLRCEAAPLADGLYRVGCIVGQQPWLFAMVVGALAAYGAYQGHRFATNR